ncbi:MAG: S-methyl-5'-thioadenosine phosphorylase [Deltaproteobacteria bacterium]|nr:S-methyl-5'-thioadenosine phosphorylase [Deltaproteobacteria bacterium]
MASTERVIGVIGGSGLYELPGLTEVTRQRVDTPFGAPSDEYVVGRLEGARMVFLPRHGRGHRLLPSEVNYRANICGLKQLGVTHLVSVSAVGSLREDIHPGTLVVVDQFIDFTRRRESTFFGGGVVGHVPMAEPVCRDLSGHLYDAAAHTAGKTRRGGTYICIEGPQFSTRAESLIWRGWGLEVIGMTAMPEAKLAREAGLCFALLALATDYDCWQEGEEDVSVEQVVKVMKANVERAKQVLVNLVGRLPAEASCASADVARRAVMTDASAVTPEMRARLKHIVDWES